MKIIVSGTVAYDIILDYPGRFADKINPEKVHVLSISFSVNKVQKSLGGTAANIAYNLSLLGAKTEIIAKIGKDGKEFLDKYKAMRIGLSGVRESKEHDTSAAYIITDKMDNQITGFYRGPMDEPNILPKLEPCDWPIIAAENPKNMARLARHYQKTKHRYIFDPGQAITSLTKKQIEICLKGASIVIGNDYEMDYILGKLTPSTSPPSFQEGEKERRRGFSPMIRGRGRGGRLGCVIIRTLGPKGSQIIFPNGKTVKIGAVKARKVVDPTGAGDAYRAGLIKGIISGLDLKRSAQLGAAAATFAVEKHGTQEHEFDYEKLTARHNKSFADRIDV